MEERTHSAPPLQLSALGSGSFSFFFFLSCQVTRQGDTADDAEQERVGWSVLPHDCGYINMTQRYFCPTDKKPYSFI